MSEFENQVLTILNKLSDNVELIATVSLFALLWYIGSKILRSFLFKV